MIQTQFAHTITVPDEWEHEGHTYQVTQDEWASALLNGLTEPMHCVCAGWSA